MLDRLLLPTMLSAIAALVGGCARCAAPAEVVAPSTAAVIEPAVEPAIPIEWRQVVTEADRQRIEALDAAWTDGLERAGTARFRTAVSGEGALLDPEAALDRPALPPGRYRCRVVKLGGRPAFAAFPPYFCFVAAEGELLTLVKETGSQRPSGRLWVDGERRLVFLGSEAREVDHPAPGYGIRPECDVAGVVERVADFRWRLVLPAPREGHRLDVIELVPFTS